MQVCQGDSVASGVRSWVNQYSGPLRIEVIRVSEGLPSVAALRSVMDRVKTDNFVLLSGDVVTEVPLRAQLLTHQLKSATVTALLGHRKGSPAADTQPGKAPRGVDYIGLAEGDRLVFYNHVPEVAKELRLPQTSVKQHPSLSLSTRLVDMQVYIFRTAVLRAVLEARQDLQKLEDHLLPFLVRRQAAPPHDVRAAIVAQRSSSGSLGSEAQGLSRALSNRSLSARSLPTLSDLEGRADAVPSFGLHSLIQYPQSAGKGWLCAAYVAPEGSYCQRANTLGGYAEVNRDSVTPELAPKLLKETPSARGENFLAPSVTLGNKVTVGAGCMVGADSTLGDRCSVKRSVVGRGCSLGANVKVINSVLQDGVKVADNCHVQNSIVCSGCTLNADVNLRDCQLGPGFMVSAGSDIKGEVLCKTAVK